MNIGGVKIGPGEPCRVVAEIGTGHNGSLTLAKILIADAAAAGADLIKLQCYTVDEMIALRGDGPAPPPWDSYGTLRELYERGRTPHEWFPTLVSTCERAGVPWFSSVFGSDSLGLLESLDCPAYKIAAPDSWSWLSEAIHRQGKPLVMSVRADYPREDEAEIMLYCPPGYPQEKIDWTQLEGVGLGAWDGLSYHGKDWTVAAKAVEMGAYMVEVHVELDDIPSELDSHSSLTVSQLRELCTLARGNE